MERGQTRPQLVSYRWRKRIAENRPGISALACFSLHVPVYSVTIWC